MQASVIQNETFLKAVSEISEFTWAVWKSTSTRSLSQGLSLIGIGGGGNQSGKRVSKSTSSPGNSSG